MYAIRILSIIHNRWMKWYAIIKHLKAYALNLIT